MRAHIMEDIKEFLKRVNTVPTIIPGGMTKLLQSLDIIAVNKSFKAGMRQTWEDWMSNGQHSFTETGRMRRATIHDVCTWIVAAWKAIPESYILSGFCKADILPEMFELSHDESSESDDEVENTDRHISGEVASLFHSDTEDKDFHGFVEEDLHVAL